MVDKLHEKLSLDPNYSDVGTLSQFRDFLTDAENARSIYNAIETNKDYTTFTRGDFNAFFSDVKKKDLDGSTSGLVAGGSEQSGPRFQSSKEIIAEAGPTFKAGVTKVMFLDPSNPYSLAPGKYIQQGNKIYNMLGVEVFEVAPDNAIPIKPQDIDESLFNTKVVKKFQIGGFVTPGGGASGAIFDDGIMFVGENSQDPDLLEISYNIGKEERDEEREIKKEEEEEKKKIDLSNQATSSERQEFSNFLARENWKTYQDQVKGYIDRTYSSQEIQEFNNEGSNWWDQETNPGVDAPEITLPPSKKKIVDDFINEKFTEGQLKGIDLREFSFFLDRKGFSEKGLLFDKSVFVDDKKKYELVNEFLGSKMQVVDNDRNILNARLELTPNIEEYTEKLDSLDNLNQTIQGIIKKYNLTPDDQGMLVATNPDTVIDPNDIALFEKTSNIYNETVNRLNEIDPNKNIPKLYNSLLSNEAEENDVKSGWQNVNIQEFPLYYKETQNQLAVDRKYADIKENGSLVKQKFYNFKRGIGALGESLNRSVFSTAAAITNAATYLQKLYGSTTESLGLGGVGASFDDGLYSSGEFFSDLFTRQAEKNIFMEPSQKMFQRGHMITGSDGNQYYVSKNKRGEIRAYDPNKVERFVGKDLMKELSEGYALKEFNKEPLIGKRDWFATVPNSIEAAGTLFYLMYTGRAFQKGLEKTFSKAISKNSGLIVSSYLLTENDLYRRAVEEGLSETEANAFSTSASLSIALLELINPNYKILGGADNQVVNNALAAFTKARSKGSKNLVSLTKETKKGAKLKFDYKTSLVNAKKEVSDVIFRSVPLEVTQELSQTISESSNEILFREATGKDVFDPAISSDEFAETAVLTAGAVIVARSGNIASSLKDTKNSRSWWDYAASNYDKLENQVALDIENGLYDAQTGFDLMANVFAYKIAAKKIPTDISDDLRMESTALQVEIDKLEKQKEGKSPAVVLQLQGEIQDLEKQLSNVLGSKTDIVNYSIGDRVATKQEVVELLNNDEYIGAVKRGDKEFDVQVYGKDDLVNNLINEKLGKQVDVTKITQEQKDSYKEIDENELNKTKEDISIQLKQEQDNLNKLEEQDPKREEISEKIGLLEGKQKSLAFYESSVPGENIERNFIEDGDYYILTAENPGAVNLSKEENVKRNQGLVSQLELLQQGNPNLKFTTVPGYYFQEEQSFIVEGLTIDQALQLGKDLQQESVVSNKHGLLYMDGTVNPRMDKGIEYGNPVLEEQTFSVATIDGKKQAFKIPIDFTNRIPFTNIEEIHGELDPTLEELIGVSEMGFMEGLNFDPTTMSFVNRSVSLKHYYVGKMLSDRLERQRLQAKGDVDKIKDLLRPAEKANRSYVMSMVSRLKQAIPNVKVIYNQDEFNKVAEKEGGTQLDRGFVAKGGVIYLNPSTVTKDTAIHEFGHIYVSALRISENEQDRALYKKGIELIKDTEYDDYVKEFYSEKSRDKQLEEALVQAIGERGANIFDAQKKNLVTSYVNELMNYIKSMMGIRPEIDIQNVNLETFLDYSAKSLLAGQELNVTKGLVNQKAARIAKEAQDNKQKLPFEIKTGSDLNIYMNQYVGPYASHLLWSQPDLWKETKTPKRKGFKGMIDGLKSYANFSNLKKRKFNQDMVNLFGSDIKKKINTGTHKGKTHLDRAYEIAVDQLRNSYQRVVDGYFLTPQNLDMLYGLGSDVNVPDGFGRGSKIPASQWYNNIKDYFEPFFGEDIDTFLDIVTILSANNKLDTNIKMAFQTYISYKLGEPLLGRHTPFEVASIDDWLKVEPGSEIQYALPNKNGKNKKHRGILIGHSRNGRQVIMYKMNKGKNEWNKTKTKVRVDKSAMINPGMTTDIKLTDPKFIKAFKGEPYGNEKLQNFRKAIGGNLDAVVLDVWMMRAFGFDTENRSNLTSSDYRLFETMIKQEAEKRNIKPAELQAAIWFGIRASDSNLKPATYESFFNEVISGVQFETTDGRVFNIKDLINIPGKKLKKGEPKADFTEGALAKQSTVLGSNINDAQNDVDFQKEPTGFYEWFGDSKLIEKDGTPKVFYHGTPHAFKAFRESGLKFFSPDPLFAEDYTKPYNFSKAGYYSGGNIIPVYLKSDNPFDYENKNHVKSLAKELVENNDLAYEPDMDDTIKRLSTGNWMIFEDQFVVSAIKKLGFDSMFISENRLSLTAEQISDGVKSTKNIAVFEPKQVRSVYREDFSDIDSPMFQKAGINPDRSTDLDIQIPGEVFNEIDFQKGIPLPENPEAHKTWDSFENRYKRNDVKMSFGSRVAALITKTEHLFFSAQAPTYKAIIKSAESAMGRNLSKEEKSQIMETATQAIIKRNLVAGATPLAKKEIKKAFDAIYKSPTKFGRRSISTKDEQYLNQIIEIRRIQQLDKDYDERGKKRLKHPNNQTSEGATVYLNELKNNLGEEKFNDLNRRADLYFQEFRNILEIKYDNGLISKTAYDRLSKLDYSPRFFMEHMFENEQDNSLGRGMTVETLKKLDKGSIDNLFNDSRWLLQTSILSVNKSVFANDANKALANLIASNPEKMGDLGYVIPFVKKGKTAFGVTVPSFVPVKEGYSILRYYENGVEKRVGLKDEVSAYWNTQDPLIKQGVAHWIRIGMGGFILRPMATGINISFAFANLPRDIQHVLTFTDNYSKFLPVALVQLGFDYKNIVSDAVRRTGQYEDYINEGGGMDLLSIQGRPIREGGTKFYQARKKQLENKGLYGRETELEKGVDAAYNVLGYINETSEVITRLAVRKRHLTKLKKQYVEDNGLENESEISADVLKELGKKATHKAREYMDFSQGGVLSKSVDNFIPYFNASMQAFRVAANYVKENPKTFLFKGVQIMAMSGGLTAYNLTWYEEDEDGNIIFDYDKISPYIKRNNFIILLPFTRKNKLGKIERMHLKIPKVQSIRFLTNFSEQTTERVVRKKIAPNQPPKYMSSEDLKATAKDALPFATNLPPVFAAWLAYSTNYDTFRMDDVWKGGFETAPWLEYYDGANGTNSFWKDAGKHFNMNDLMGEADEVSYINPLTVYTVTQDLIEKYSKENNIESSEDIPESVMEDIKKQANDLAKETIPDFTMEGGLSPERLKRAFGKVFTNPDHNLYLNMMGNAYEKITNGMTDEERADIDQTMIQKIEDLIEPISRRFLGFTGTKNYTVDENIEEVIVRDQNTRKVIADKVDQYVREYKNALADKNLSSSEQIKKSTQIEKMFLNDFLSTFPLTTWRRETFELTPTQERNINNRLMEYAENRFKNKIKMGNVESDFAYNIRYQLDNNEQRALYLYDKLHELPDSLRTKTLNKIILDLNASGMSSSTIDGILDIYYQQKIDTEKLITR